jgi:hypothetical protein
MKLLEFNLLLHVIIDVFQVQCFSLCKVNSEDLLLMR